MWEMGSYWNSDICFAQFYLFVYFYWIIIIRILIRTIIKYAEIAH